MATEYPTPASAGDPNQNYVLWSPDTSGTLPNTKVLPYSVTNGQLLAGSVGGGDYVLRDNVVMLQTTFDTLAINATKDFYLPVACTIQSVTILNGASGLLATCTIDIRACLLAAYPPTSGQSLASATKPNIVANTYVYSDSTLTGWTTAIPAGSVLQAKCTAIGTLVAPVSLIIAVRKTS